MAVPLGLWMGGICALDFIERSNVHSAACICTTTMLSSLGGGILAFNCCTSQNSQNVLKVASVATLLGCSVGYPLYKKLSDQTDESSVSDVVQEVVCSEKH